MERSADWLDRAQGDLAHAGNDVVGGFYDWACFSAHQAAEKAVKAVLQRKGEVGLHPEPLPERSSLGVPAPALH